MGQDGTGQDGNKLFSKLISISEDNYFGVFFTEYLVAHPGVSE